MSQKENQTKQTNFKLRKHKMLVECENNIKTK